MKHPPHHARLRRGIVYCLWLYPHAWRLRYEEEMLALLDRYPVTFWTVADVLMGAVDSHLHHQLLPQEVLTMAQQLRTSANALFAAFSLFFIAWIMVPFIQDTPGIWATATAHHSEIRSLLAIFMGVGGVAVLALLVGGLPLLANIVGQAIKERRRDLLWRLVTPILLIGALVAFSVVAQPTWWHRLGVTFPNSALWVKVSFFLLAFLTIGASTWAITSAATRSQLSDGLLRFTRIPGILLGLALGICCVALLTLTILVLAEAPELAQPWFLLPIFNGLLLFACWIGGAAMRRMITASHVQHRE